VISLQGSTPAARRRLTVRVLGAAAVLAFVVGLVIGAVTPSGPERVTRDFAKAWDRGDYARMYSMLTPDAKKRVSEAGFRAAYLTAANTATATELNVSKTHGTRLVVQYRTRIFGEIRGTMRIPVVDDHVDWRPSMVFPGLGPGATLTRKTQAPRRAAILSRNGRTIVSGPGTARVVASGSPA